MGRESQAALKVTASTVGPSRKLANSAIQALLDHVAEELAREFVSLMKAAVEEDEEQAPDEAGENEEQ